MSDDSQYTERRVQNVEHEAERSRKIAQNYFAACQLSRQVQELQAVNEDNKTVFSENARTIEAQLAKLTSQLETQGFSLEASKEGSTEGTGSYVPVMTVNVITRY